MPALPPKSTICGRECRTSPCTEPRMVTVALVVVWPGPDSSPLLSMPRIQFTRFCISVVLLAPNLDWQVLVFAVIVATSNSDGSPDAAAAQLLLSAHMSPFRSDQPETPVIAGLGRYCF